MKKLPDEFRKLLGVGEEQEQRMEDLESKKKTRRDTGHAFCPSQGIGRLWPSAAPKSQQAPFMTLHQWLPLFKDGPCHISCFMAFVKNTSGCFSKLSVWLMAGMID